MVRGNREGMDSSAGSVPPPLWPLTAESRIIGLWRVIVIAPGFSRRLPASSWYGFHPKLSAFTLLAAV